MAINPSGALTRAFKDKSLIGIITDYCVNIMSNRNILKGLIINDLKGRYSNSFFGYLWHVINPIVQILIYSIVFSQLMGRGIDNYWVYLSVGVFAYNYFSSALNSATSSIVSHRSMVTKMSFPREILIISSVGVCFISFVISYSILLIALIVLDLIPNVLLLALVPIVIIVETIFILGISLVFGALNVFYRDISYGVQILTTMLIFLTPIFYVGSLGTELLQFVHSINPMCYYVEALHDLIYFGNIPSLIDLCIGFGFAIILFAGGLILFKILEKWFAEKL